MKQGFEKAFTDIQTGLISLCLEGASVNAGVVYAYAYMGDGSYMFNMFFDCNGLIVPSHKVIQDKDILMEVLKYGNEDLEKLKIVCDEYETECPIEMKMCYNCVTKKYYADYKYKNSYSTDIDPHQSFIEWRKEVEAAKY